MGQITLPFQVTLLIFCVQVKILPHIHSPNKLLIKSHEISSSMIRVKVEVLHQASVFYLFIYFRMSLILPVSPLKQIVFLNFYY